jgi:hypothetical protein
LTLTRTAAPSGFFTGLSFPTIVKLRRAGG